MTFDKAGYERRIFELLAPLAGYSVAPDSIRQPDPPDVECSLTDGSTFAAELVALDDPYTQQSINNCIDTKACWYDVLREWPDAQRQQLNAMTRDLVLFCGFGNSAGSRDRREVFRRVQRAMLEQLPPDFKGDLMTQISQPSKPRGIKHIRAERSGTTGIKIAAPTAGRLLEPAYAKLEEKLKRQCYTTTASTLHLFAYSVHDELDGHTDSLSRLESIARQHLPASPFHAVHFFNAAFERHLLTVR